MEPDEHPPGEPARRSGRYEERNVFGTRRAAVPGMSCASGKVRDCPRRRAASHRDATTKNGRLYELRPAELQELQARAAEYSRMAETATTADVRDSLLRVAEILEEIAADFARRE
jgi:hypothetical protein